MVNVYVIGGGVTGLNIAREFSCKRLNVTLFESSDRLGGLAGYIKAFDRNLDLGPHIFHTPDNDIKEYLQESFPGKFFERQHWAKNYKNGEYYDYPISEEFIETLPKKVKHAIKNELNIAKSKKYSLDMSYADYIENLAGPTLTKLFFTQYPYKLWGVPTSQLDANWAPKRVEIRKNKTPFYSNQWSAVGVNGTSSIIDEMVEQCCKSGVDIRTRESVNKFEVKNSCITAIETNNKIYSVGPNDIVINTASMTKSAQFFGFNSSISYRGVCLVYIHSRNANPFGAGIDFIYVDSLDIIFNRISDQNKFVATPEKESTVICCEITYSKNDYLDQMSDVKIVEKTIDGLISMGIIEENEVLGNHVERLPEVYPMFTIGYRQIKSKVLAKVNSLNNLFTLGSLAEFSYTDLQVLFAKSRDFVNEITSKTASLNNIAYGRTNIALSSSVGFLGFELSNDSPCFLIAEIGLNHNGSIQLAKDLILSAKNAGFDAVKFQAYNSSLRSNPDGITSKYVEKILKTEETDFDTFKKYELTETDLSDLFEYANEVKIPIFSAAFDIASAKTLLSLGSNCIKIASSELTNTDLISFLGEKKLPVIFSTGMSGIGDIEEAINVFQSAGGVDYALLHCTSSYPAPPEALNLNAIRTMEQCFKVPVGYSDHYDGDAASIAALALGAKIIEKHITLNKQLEGPDHALSLEPAEQIIFVREIRNIEMALGSGVKRPHPSEKFSELRFRKTCHFKMDLKRGHVINENDIILTGPGDGLLPKFKPFIINRRLKHDVSKNSPITLDAFGE